MPLKGCFHSVAKGIVIMKKIGKYLNDIIPSFNMGFMLDRCILHIRYIA